MMGMDGNEKIAIGGGELDLIAVKKRKGFHEGTVFHGFEDGRGKPKGKHEQEHRERLNLRLVGRVTLSATGGVSERFLCFALGI
jgi:hypothetical protein